MRLKESNQGSDFELLRKEIADTIGISPGEISGQDNLYDFGLDSMRLVRLILQWEKRGLTARFFTLAEKSTLEELFNTLHGAK